jgi:hypothetical protein
VVACLSATALGYALLGGYIRHNTGLDGHTADDVEGMLVAVLHDIAQLAFLDRRASAQAMTPALHERP